MIRELNHSAFSLYYELVLVSKNKAPIFEKEVAEFGIEIFKNIGATYFVDLLDVHYEKTHIHFKFEAYPITNLYKFINVYKSASSRKIKNKFESVKQYLNSPAMWEGNYFLMTVGISSKDLVLHYIDEYIKCDEINHEHTGNCENKLD